MAYIQGGVEIPVGLTVFKTAGGSLRAVLGGFDSHTPLLYAISSAVRIPVYTLETGQRKQSYE